MSVGVVERSRLRTNRATQSDMHANIGLCVIADIFAEEGIVEADEGMLLYMYLDGML